MCRIHSSISRKVVSARFSKNNIMYLDEGYAMATDGRATESSHFPHSRTRRHRNVNRGGSGGGLVNNILPLFFSVCDVASKYATLWQYLCFILSIFFYLYSFLAFRQ